ncbi:hypothetical protein [Nocardia sp. NPDC059228]|uniref:hypothetical protein n=1 Tax=Nocardia sp. NPDC059228 TaxID=3346777 RepID=UPI0036B856A9
MDAFDDPDDIHDRDDLIERGIGEPFGRCGEPAQGGMAELSDDFDVASVLAPVVFAILVYLRHVNSVPRVVVSSRGHSLW